MAALAQAQVIEVQQYGRHDPNRFSTGKTARNDLKQNFQKPIVP